MFKIVACMLGAAVLSLSAAGAETGVSTAGEASSPCKRMVWNRGWEFRLEDDPGKSGWQTAHLPHTFSLPYFMSDSFYTGRRFLPQETRCAGGMAGAEGFSGLRRSLPGGGGDGEREGGRKA